jgi:hypothetical protein
MVVFLPQLTVINIEIPPPLPSGSVRTRTRGGASRMKDAIGKITGGVRCFRGTKLESAAIAGVPVLVA